MASNRTITQLQRTFLVASLFLLGACSDLDPVKVESKCEGPAPIDARCPQCQIPQFASECPQCQLSGPDDGTCLPPGVPWKGDDTQTSGSTTVLPDGGTVAIDGGQTDAPGMSGESGGSDSPSGSGGKSGADAKPGSSSGGNGAPGNASGAPAMAGRMAPTQGSNVCMSDEGCMEAGFPACRGDGKCVPCLQDRHCPNGLQCDAPNVRCVECVNDEPCTPQGKVCSPTDLRCVECNDDNDCPADKRTCTPDHTCVPCVDGGPNKYCPTETPACFQNTCVACNGDADCTGSNHACIKEEHRCVECTLEAQCRGIAGRPHCDTTSNACVACLKDADCSDPSASQCDVDSHTCVPCNKSTQCARFSATPVCADERCVVCSREDSACGGKACIFASNTCSDKNRQSVAACNECQSSDECIAGHVCVPTTFQSGGTGNRCLPNYADYKQAGKPCPRPYSRRVMKVQSVDGFSIDTLCALPDTTSCSALLDTLSSKECGGNNLNCGLGEYDGYCGMDGCTYNCTSNDFCPGAMTCSETQRICL